MVTFGREPQEDVNSSLTDWQKMSITGMDFLLSHVIGV